MNYGGYCTKWRLAVQNSKLQPPWQLISNAGIKNNTRAMVEEGNGESRKLSPVTRVLKIILVLWWGEWLSLERRHPSVTRVLKIILVLWWGEWFSLERRHPSVTRVLKIIPASWRGKATINPLSWRRIASQNTTNSDCRLCNSVAIYHCVATLLMPNT